MKQNRIFCFHNTIKYNYIYSQPHSIHFIAVLIHLQLNSIQYSLCAYLNDNKAYLSLSLYCRNIFSFEVVLYFHLYKAFRNINHMHTIIFDHVLTLIKDLQTASYVFLCFLCVTLIITNPSSKNSD